jgi:hypothetical protein
MGVEQRGSAASLAFGPQIFAASTARRSQNRPLVRCRIVALAGAARRVLSISGNRSALRWSAQMIAGRSRRLLRSSNTNPCIWPEKPMPKISGPSALSNASRTAATVALHQCSGSCSAYPRRGVRIGYSARPTAFSFIPASKNGLSNGSRPAEALLASEQGSNMFR